MKYTEVSNQDILLSLNAGAQALLMPGNAVNLPYMRELIIEAERRQELVAQELREIKAEVTRPKEVLKKEFESAAELGRLALKHDIERNGQTVSGISLVVGKPVPELPLEDHPAYRRLIGYLLGVAPDTVKTSIDSSKFKAWFAKQHTVVVQDMIELGVDIIESTHVRFS